MARRARPSVARPLRCNDLLFINEYLANGRNATQAYRSVHPKCSYDAARSTAPGVLAKPSVQAEVARRMTHAGGITREFVESALLTHYQTAADKGDYLAGASIAMDCAKLAGFLVEKREVKQVNEEQSSAIRSLVARTFRLPTATETATSTHLGLSPSSAPTLSTPSPSAATLPPTVSESEPTATSAATVDMG